jgi:hypothetical protein
LDIDDFAVCSNSVKRACTPGGNGALKPPPSTQKPGPGAGSFGEIPQRFCGIHPRKVWLPIAANKRMFKYKQPFF